MNPPRRPRLEFVRHAAAVFAVIPLAATLTTAAFAQSESTAHPAPDTTAARATLDLRPDPALSESLHTDHLENVTAFRGPDSSAVVTYENRYYRHGATALGHVVRDADEP